MPIVTTQRFRGPSEGGTARLVSVEISRPPWPVRAALVCAALVLAAAAVLIAVPVVLLAGLLLVAFIGAARLRLAFAGLRAPNGPLDGRRNVRVVALGGHPADPSEKGEPDENPPTPAAGL